MNYAEQQLGVTRSSKPILQPVQPDVEILAAMTVEYTAADHFDAYALYQYLIARELATLGRDSPRLKLYDIVGRFHRESLGTTEFQLQMKTLAIATIFDVIEFGKCRADPIFP